jgi:uncharacterized protein (TIGR02588 family)
MPQKKEEVSRYEWLAAALGGVIFLALIGYFAREAMRLDGGPPDIVARVDSVTRASAGYIAHITATNAGGSAATAVRILGELTRDGADPETAEVTLDLLGRRSRQSAGLYFSRDPAQHQLRVRPVSFLVP